MNNSKVLFIFYFFYSKEIFQKKRFKRFILNKLQRIFLVKTDLFKRSNRTVYFILACVVQCLSKKKVDQLYVICLYIFTLFQNSNPNNLPVLSLSCNTKIFSLSAKSIGISISLRGKSSFIIVKIY